MDYVASIVNTPSWAYDLCWYYFAVAAIIAIAGVWSVVNAFMQPAAMQKGLLPMVLTTILSVGVTVVLALLQFWICRGALASSRKEKFAVNCKSRDDCTAVMGEPQPEECECGGRGYCGGCKMRNNMQPQASFAAEFGSVSGSGSGSLAPAM